MKDKTHAMNQDRGEDVIPNSEIVTRRQYRKRKNMEAGLDGPTAPLNSSLQIEDVNEENADDDGGIGGFLPRNNYEDRF
jgi:hypothetical protein